MSRDSMNFRPDRRVRHPEEERKRGPSIRRENLDDSMMKLDHAQIGDNQVTTLDDANINIELEQGRSSQAGKLQHALLKQSAPLVHCQYIG